ncbi:MAG: prolipoprotein diacylglyceryl transferase [Candidatus Schekmanbacteria bacterium]|nr:prolipoprotein diacylglyceryl transferase [Candidatus Schekmanbacteria bacterium]
MYPVIFEIRGFTLSSYGLMMSVAFIVTGWLLCRELGRRNLDPQWAFEIVWRAALGGVVGAKIYYAILHQDPWALVSRGGLVWYGGFIGGASLVLLYALRHRLPLREVVDSVAVFVPLGYAFGRVGCFLVGDDYGRPTDSWLGIVFPNGSPPSTVRNLREHFGFSLPPSFSDTTVLAVHPTQLYEIGLSLVVFAILYRLRLGDRPRGFLLGCCLTLMGIERFIVEFFRVKDDRMFAALTLAQMISVAVCACGVGLAIKSRRRGA